MDTHYHLLLHDETGGLSRALRHLNGVYTQIYNQRHRRDGPLMRGRFRSRVVQKERYALELVRYIHANPVRAKMVKRAGQYRWSSHRYYLSRQRPDWLQVDHVLDEFGGDTPAGRRELDAFVHERVPDEIEQVLSQERWAPVVGDARFVEECRQRAKGHKQRSSPEVPAGKRLVRLTVAKVVTAAREEFGLSAGELQQGKRGQENRHRIFTLLVCRDHSGASGAEIGRQFGIAASTVSVLAMRARELVQKDPAARRLLARLVNRLGLKHNKQDKT